MKKLLIRIPGFPEVKIDCDFVSTFNGTTFFVKGKESHWHDFGEGVVVARLIGGVLVQEVEVDCGL